MAAKTKPSIRDEKILSAALTELASLGPDGATEAAELGAAYGDASFWGMSFGTYQNHLDRVRRSIAEYGQRVDLSVCESCRLFVDGYDAHELGLTDADPAPLSLISEDDGYLINRDDEPGFSWSDCDGCGALPGNRYRVTLMPRTR